MLKAIFDEIIQTVAEHPGATVLSCDVPPNVGWSVYWTDENGEEGSRLFSLKLDQISGSLDELGDSERALLSGYFRSAAGRQILADSLVSAGESLRLRKGA